MSVPIHSESYSSAPAMILREPLLQPSTIERVNSVRFCHPGYHAPTNVLFTLSLLDDLSTSLKGVHHRTALTACKIIANNAINGYLTTDREGRNRVNPNPDYMLTESEYWFFAGLEYETIYPVVPSFQDWEFPHGSPIVNWPKPGGTTGADASKYRCVITSTAEIVHSAHIIPLADQQWFEKNGMHQYGDQSRSDIQQTGNTTTLRHDLHYAFDDNWFTIVPKQNRYVVHQFHATTPGRREFAANYHNVPVLQGLENLAPEFLFARFARSVLMLAKAFIANAPVSRRIARFSVADNENAERKTEAGAKLEWLRSEQLHQQYGGDTKSASPGKRKRGTEQEQEEEDDHSDYEGSDDSDAAGKWYEENVAVLLEEDRGRSRKRRCDDGVGSDNRPAGPSNSQGTASTSSPSSSFSSINSATGLDGRLIHS